jgi:hypothetical protein
MAQPPHAAVAALQAEVAELRLRPAFVAADRLDQLARDMARVTLTLYGNGTKDQPGLTARVDDHDTVIKPTRSLARWALGGAATAALLVAAFLYHRGGAEQLVTDKLQQLERASERCDHFIDHRPDLQQGPHP